MIIKTIRFENYRAYYGEVRFDLPIDDEKNISIIFANNDVGKSCFFSGVLFCMYGPKEDMKDYINVNSFNEGDYQASVTMFVEHNGEDIEMTRIIQLRGKVQGLPASKDFESTLTVISNGKPLTADNEEKADFINSLIHEDAAQYFFFDGEKINDYSIANSEKYKDAIARILGIKEIENTISDLSQVQKEYERDRDEVLKKLDKHKDVLQQKKDIEQEVLKNKNLLDKYELEIQAAVELIQKHEDELKKFDDKKEQVEQKQELTVEIKQQEDLLKEIEQKRNDCFKKNSSMILGMIAYNRIVKDFPEKPLEYYISSAVKEHLIHLMREDKCSCGEDMTPVRIQNTEKYIEKNFLADEALLLEKERETMFYGLTKYQNHGSESKYAYLQLNGDIFGIQADIATKKQRLIELKKDIGSFDEEAGEKIIADIARVEEKREEAKERRSETKLLLRQFKERLQGLEAKLAEFSQADAKSAELQRKSDYATKLLGVFTEYLDQLLEEKRQLVETKATEVFMQITNNPKKYKGICIADNYSLMLELTDGGKYQIEPGRMLNPSTGQSKVISLAYIAGLNRSTNYAAPVVIDNPLGLFSDEHRASITGYLPHFGKQIIFMVSSGDLSEKYHNIISPYVKTEYFLENFGDQTWPKTTIAERRDY